MSSSLLFGAGLIVFSLVKPECITDGSRQRPCNKRLQDANIWSYRRSRNINYVGAVSVPETDEDRARMRTETQQDIVALNRALDGANETDRPKWNALFPEPSSR